MSHSPAIRCRTKKESPVGRAFLSPLKGGIRDIRMCGCERLKSLRVRCRHHRWNVIEEQGEMLAAQLNHLIESSVNTVEFTGLRVAHVQPWSQGVDEPNPLLPG